MNFTEAQGAVLGLIKRPDKAAAVGVAINAILSRNVLKTEFTQDLVEATIPLDSNEYSQTIDLTTLVDPLTRFRKWKYVKLPGVLGYLKPIDPLNVFVPGGFTQTDCYYMMGSKLTVISSSLASSLLVGYYQYAPVLSGSNEHWLLTLCPYCVIYQATGEVLISMGDTSTGKTYLAMGQQMYEVAANDFRDQITY